MLGNSETQNNMDCFHRFIPVMGHVLANGLDLMGTGRTMRRDNQFGRALYDMAILADNQKDQLSDREKLHVKAVRLWADE